MRKTLLTLVAAGSLAAAPAALAADHTATLAPASPSFGWAGGPGTNVGVNVPELGGVAVGSFTGCADGIADCEEILLKVEAAGKLTVLANADDDSTDAIDIYLYESNEAGEYEDGDVLGGDEDISEAQGATPASDEKIEMQVQPGYYLAQVRFFDAQDDTYKGTATLSGFPEPAAAQPTTPPATEQPQQQPAQQQPAQQQPQQQPAQQQPQQQPAAKDDAKKRAVAKKKKACQKKAKKIKNAKKRKAALKKCSKIKK